MNCEKLVRMKVVELKALLRRTDRTIKGVSKMTKPQLIGRLTGRAPAAAPRPTLRVPKTPTPRPKTPAGLKAGIRMMLNNKRALKDAPFTSNMIRGSGEGVGIEAASDKIKQGLEVMNEGKINTIITNIGRFVGGGKLVGPRYGYEQRQKALEGIAMLGWEIKNRPQEYQRAITKMRKLGYI